MIEAIHGLFREIKRCANSWMGTGSLIVDQGLWAGRLGNWLAMNADRFNATNSRGREEKIIDLLIYSFIYSREVILILIVERHLYQTKTSNVRLELPAVKAELCS